MADELKKKRTKQEPVFSWRAPKEERPLVLKMARETSRSPGQVLGQCFIAVREMVEAPGPIRPRWVHFLRTLREHGAVMTEPPKAIRTRKKRSGK